MAFNLATFAYATDKISYSSFTATNDTALIRSVTSTNTIPTTLSAVIVSSPTTGGLLKIYSSTFTTANLVANISLTNIGYYDFRDVPMRGIYYATTVNSNGVTIIYKY